MTTSANQRLFATAKVPLFLDTIVHATEKRKSDDVKVVVRTLRVQPFGPELASSIDEGVQAAHGIKPLLFSLNNAEPKALVRRMDVGLGCPRQQLLVFASSDTVKESIALDQVKVSGTYARTQKDVAGYAFVFRASFGPLGRKELEFIQDWHLSTRFVTFNTAEPSLEFGPEVNRDEDEATDQDQKAREAVRPPFQWDEKDAIPGDVASAGASEGQPAQTSVVEQEVGARRTMHSHQAKHKPGRKAADTGGVKGKDKGKRRVH